MTTPTKLHLSEVPAALASKIDLFVCSASFEDRCLSIPLALPQSRVVQALVCANADFDEYLSANQRKLVDHFGSKASPVDLWQNNPVAAFDSLRRALLPGVKTGPKAVVVDATTFTHEGLLLLLRLLSIQTTPADSVTILYAPAAEYAVGLSNPDKWLSRGLREVRSVLGFPGLMGPSRKLHLIVLVGFEGERARLLIDACEPDVISLGRANDATDTNQTHVSINLDTLEQLSVHYPEFDRFAFSSVDVEATVLALSTQMDRYVGYNTIVAPMNTKLSTIGAALFALSRPAVQLCYAPALTYNYPAYSAASDYCLLIPLTFPRLTASEGS